MLFFQIASILIPFSSTTRRSRTLRVLVVLHEAVVVEVVDAAEVVIHVCQGRQTCLTTITARRHKTHGAARRPSLASATARSRGTPRRAS